MRSTPLNAAVRVAALALGLFVCACSTAKGPDGEVDPYAVNDPLETVNRGIFSFNVAADDYVIRPVSQAYRDTMPKPVQKSVHAFLTNLKGPVILFNDAIQGQGKLAGDTFIRLWLNTILGLGGIMDVATDLGYAYHDADFGQTFGVWGVPAGPYLVLPILGPSNPRDAVGLAVGEVADPFDGLMRKEGADGVIYGRAVVSGIDLRSRNIDILDRIRSTSLDYYSEIRSLYIQRREAQIRHEAPPANSPEVSP